MLATAPIPDNSHGLQFPRQPLGLAQPLANFQLPRFQQYLQSRQQTAPRNVTSLPPARSFAPRP